MNDIDSKKIETEPVVLYNSMGGEWIEIERGEYGYTSFTHQLFWRGSGYMASHLHEDFDEIFLIETGSAHYEIDGVKHRAKAGDVIIFPKGVKHVNPYNASNLGKPLVLYAEKPSEDMVDFYVTYYSLVTKEVFLKNKHGLPTDIQYLALNHLLALKTRFCVLPVWKERLYDFFFGHHYDKYLSR